MGGTSIVAANKIISVSKRGKINSVLKYSSNGNLLWSNRHLIVVNDPNLILCLQLSRSSIGEGDTSLYDFYFTGNDIGHFNLRESKTTFANLEGVINSFNDVDVFDAKEIDSSQIANLRLIDSGAIWVDDLEYGVMIDKKYHAYVIDSVEPNRVAFSRNPPSFSRVWYLRDEEVVALLAATRIGFHKNRNGDFVRE